MSEMKDIAVQMVKTMNRSLQGRYIDITTQRWRWPTHHPDTEAHESWLSAMDTIRKQVDSEANVGERVATLVVDVETRVVRNWALDEEEQDVGTPNAAPRKQGGVYRSCLRNSDKIILQTSIIPLPNTAA
jgi:hypothetical protein